jgi:hypothetical protein
LAAEVEFAPSVSDADTPRKRLAQFRAAVESLPVPKDKKLRYLAIRLRKLVQTFEDWVDASEVVQASLASSEDPLYLDEARNERDASLKYAHELGILAAAERVALGSSDIRDHATEAFETTDTLPVSKRSDDSAYASQERFVRSQIAELR